MGNTSKRTVKTRHYFFLSPYDDMGFTRCPKCQGKTKLRKFPLVIHIDPNQLFVLNKKCKYCTDCDLIITKQSEVEELVTYICEKRSPDMIGNDYLVVGTMERSDWRQSQAGKMNPQQTMEKVFVFEEVLSFETIMEAINVHDRLPKM